MCTVHRSHPDRLTRRAGMKFQRAETWRNGDEGAKGGERAIEGGERRSGQTAAARRELSIAGVPTQLPTLFIPNMNINERLLKYSHSSSTCSSHQATSAARARPCSATDMSCLQCEKSACCPLPATQPSHRTASVLRACRSVSVRTLLHCLTHESLRCLWPGLSLCAYSKSMFVFVFLAPP